jgi:Glyoxalase superfamily protein/Clp amino terminal domain, pathogenicity island component
MRDFRDAKSMAHTLRAALTAKGLKITISQSLEMIAEVFGVADWNTLSAAIHAEELASRASPPKSTADSVSKLGFSSEFGAAQHKALAAANQRKHEYATLEHLLLALTDDIDASTAMKACNADLAALRENITSYIDNGLNRLVVADGRESKPTAAFQRVIQRAMIHAQGRGGLNVTGGDLLVAIFAERERESRRTVSW